jgi:hypothetical protein
MGGEGDWIEVITLILSVLAARLIYTAKFGQLDHDKLKRIGGGI